MTRQQYRKKIQIEDFQIGDLAEVGFFNLQSEIAKSAIEHWAVD